MTRLGPFSLEEKVGAGATSTVWRARHTTGTAAAIKVLTGAVDRHRGASLGREVRAAARLNHPGIVAVFDTGAVTAEEAPGVGVEAGAPYLVLEYAPDGSLADLPVPLPWAYTRSTLLAILDALGHAHARRVIHRDLKPENLVLAGPTAPRPGLKITDFGVAYALGDPEAPVAGTAWTMAPEQIRGETSRLGPWTDLYALACVGWLLATGERPFTGLSGDALLDAHLFELPTPPARFVAPPGFVDWLLRGLDKAPGARFDLAADAARLLAALPETWRGIAPRSTIRDPRTATLATVTRDFTSAVRPSTPMSPVAAPTPATPPPPPTWHPHRTAALVPDPGIGLRLLPHRTVPFVARNAERDRLWRAFREIASSGRSAILHLWGPEGSGRRRLGTWLCERAEETGTGRGFVLDDPIEDLCSAIRATHQVGDATVDDATATLAAWVGDPVAARALAQVLCEAPRSTPPTATRAILAAEVDRLARARPVVLVMPDHPLVRALDRRASPLLVLAVTTEPTDPGVEVAPLAASDIRDALRSLIALEPNLAEELSNACEGNPRLALATLGDLVAQGNLHPTPLGLALVPGAELPAVGLDPWKRRVDEALHDVDLGTAEAIERLAVLGPRPTWADVDAVATRTALEPLASRGLVAEDERGVRFAHPWVRRALVDRAAPRLTGHHDRCAAALTAVGAPPARIGPHLASGSHPADAVDVLWSAAVQPGIDVATQRAMLRLYDAVLDELGAPRSGALRLRGRLRLAEAARFEGHVDEARALGEEAARLAREAGHTELEARAVSDLGRVARREGDLTRSRELLDQALSLAVASGSPGTESLVRFDLAVVLTEQGRLAEADTQLVLAHACAQTAGQRPHIGRIFRARYLVARQQGDLDRAATLLDAAAAVWEATGDVLGAAGLLISRGVMAGARGDTEGALASFRLAADRLHALGHAEEHLARINLGISLSNRGRFDDARAELITCLNSPAGAGTNRGPLQVFLLACEATLGDWTAWDVRIEEAERLLRDSGRADADLAQALERAAGLAAAAPERATHAWRLARDQWLRLGRTDDAARVAAHL